jgi:hypothetical protein
MKKFAIPFLALILAVGFSAFKAPKQSDKADSPVMYWYEVDQFSQRILAGTPVYAHSPKEDVVTPCDDDGEDDCLRGFFVPQNTTSDIYSGGDAQIRVSQE